MMIGTIFALTIVLVLHQALQANAAFLGSLFGGKDNQYIIFDTMGKCKQYVENNPDLGYNENDCHKGNPPPPTPSP